MEKVIGIDLGTTNSCVAIFENGRASVIPNRAGYKTTPSIVAITDTGKRLVGRIAKRQAVTNSENTVYATKRLIGRPFGSPEVQRAIATCPYQVMEGPEGTARIALAGRDYPVPEISAYILMEMKRIAEEYVGSAVKNAVITVPAYFSDGQRQATKDAGVIAGLEVLRIINEPTAAALCYGYDKNLSQKIAVFDLGGGTFDVSILEIGDGIFEVLSTAGDTFLGGENFDSRIIDHIADRFQQENGVDLRSDPMALQRLKEESEKAKIDLSEQMRREIHLPFIASDGKNALHLKLELTRSRLEKLVNKLADRCLRICKHALADAGLGVEDIEEVVLVGGQTRMPLIQKKVEEFFRRAPSKGVHPDEAVALGAAIQGSALVNDKVEVLLLDVTPMSLGVATSGGGITKLIPRNTKVPTVKKHLFTTVNDNQEAVKISVLQGEGDTSQGNVLLGEFMLTGIRRAVKGGPEIEVSFSIDANGIVNVSARDLATGARQSVVINNSGGMTDKELSKLAREQQEFAVRARTDGEQDKILQRSESLILDVSRALSRAHGSLSKNREADVHRVLSEARRAMDDSDFGRLKKNGKEMDQILKYINAL